VSHSLNTRTAYDGPTHTQATDTPPLVLHSDSGYLHLPLTPLGHLSLHGTPGHQIQQHQQIQTKVSIRYLEWLADNMVTEALGTDTPQSADSPVPPLLHGPSPSNSANSEGGSIDSQATTSNMPRQESETPPSTSTRATTPNVTQPQTQTPNTTVPAAGSTDDTSPGHDDYNSQAVTPDDDFVNLQLKYAKALESNKRKATENPSLSSSKKQKKANAMAKPTAKNSIK
jgi:hypothetical protein